MKINSISELTKKFPGEIEKIENEVKQEITEIYNESSLLFWYPPKGLLTEQTI